MTPTTCDEAIGLLIATARLDADDELIATPAHRQAWRHYRRLRRAEMRAEHPAVGRRAPVAAPAPRQQPRQRSRRSTAVKKAAGASKGSDGPEPPRFIVNLPPPDPDGVRRVARLLVERAYTEVVNRRALGSANSDAAEAATPTASRSKVL
jgi:hypothetical protein